MPTVRVISHAQARRIVDVVTTELESRDLAAAVAVVDPMTNFGDLRYTGWGGGVPVVSDGSVVGAVGVSGLVEDLDMELANRGAECLDGL